MMLLLGNCLEQMKDLPENSVDSIVTDPPYGLSFMGKHWDYDVPTEEIWREALRVLKPGGHLLSFFGTRTYHRGVVRIEDAGFEIRDQIMWIYGSGFPKSHNIDKAIDKMFGAEREVIGIKSRAGGFDRGVLSNTNFGNKHSPDNGDITAPKSDQAKQWQGWGTALKPANEPIVVARKPLEKGLTVAENVLKWGTGAINVDESRIGTELIQGGRSGRKNVSSFNVSIGEKPPMHQGRWPANILFDEEAAEILGEPSRFFYVAKASKSERNAGIEGMITGKTSQFTKGGLKCVICNKWKNSGNPCQCVNPNFEQQQWNGTESLNHHPTVKPIKLMQYLIKLVTPPNGTVLDPFMGSGSTGVAAKNLGFDFIGCEMNEEYFEIAKKRIGV